MTLSSPFRCRFQRDRLLATFLDYDRGTPHEAAGTFTRRIAAVLKHGAYGTGGTYNNDIALLRVEGRIPFGGAAAPVCLPEAGKSFTGRTG